MGSYDIFSQIVEIHLNKMKKIRDQQARGPKEKTVDYPLWFPSLFEGLRKYMMMNKGQYNKNYTTCPVYLTFETLVTIKDGKHVVRVK